VDKKPLSESDIGDKFIRPAMEAAGWNGMDRFYREFPLRAARVGVRGQKSRPRTGKMPTTALRTTTSNWVRAFDFSICLLHSSR
jgi:type I site-specific restriction endonuclease